jgi:hypothetical protein
VSFNTKHINPFYVLKVNFFFRDSFGDFFSRLETVHGVSQLGVQDIAREMIHLSKSVLSHSMTSVTDHLGR